MPVPNAPGSSVAGAADLCALGRADCEVECLEALLTQLIKGDVLADLNAGLELYAQILENLDLGIDNVLFEAEGGYAHGEHAAERLFLFVNGHGVALDCRDSTRSSGRQGLAPMTAIFSS